MCVSLDFFAGVLLDVCDIYRTLKELSFHIK